jgi:hypothetical protein
MDTHGETAEIFETLFDPATEDLYEEFQRFFGYPSCGNFLVIDRVEVLARTSEGWDWDWQRCGA